MGEPRWKREVREGVRALVKDYTVRKLEQQVIAALEAAIANSTIPPEQALATARAAGAREGAEAMREACAAECDRLFRRFSRPNRGADYQSAEYRAGWENGLEAVEDNIRALPLPTKGDEDGRDS